ncbi:MAG: hypothetical protein SP4CHLAM5_00080 [Chlamydiia bacterium]|nr:hypothetical protein [Chlamydiia bacterium]MCH9617889.1 hypothetical protein [Chlamydiia bacterium]MCH9624104.1 hypothetical protein [Chlamydiia bacterium]
MKTYFTILFLFLVSCSPSTLSEWRVEGVSIVKDLVEELKEIDDFKSLQAKKASIKKKYNKLVGVMIEAEKYEQEQNTFLPESFYSDALKAQYIRLYQIEGCKELLFAIQKESLHRLDLSITKKL